MIRPLGILIFVSKGLCAVLCVYCAVQAKAGFAYYQGVQAIETKDTEKALTLFNRAERLGYRAAALEFDLAEAFYAEGLKKKDGDLLQQSESRFEKLSERLPEQGRSSLYQALAALARTVNRDDRGLTEWTGISQLLKEAVKRQPGNLWIQFNTSTTALTHDRFLSREEKQTALKGLERASAILPERYLAPSLSFLWERYKKTGLLRNLTPRTHGAYKILLDFLYGAEEWNEWHKVYSVYRKMRQAAYEELCRLGEASLAEDHYEEAEKQFQEAFWLDPSSAWGRAGFVISFYGHKMALPEEKSTQTFFKTMLEGELSIGNLLPRLGPVIRETGDAYLKGLYLLRTKRPEDAAAEFETVSEEKLAPYYLALSYKQMGDLKSAKSVLLSSRGETLSARETQLLQELDPAAVRDLRTEPETPGASQKKLRRGWWAETGRNEPLTLKGKTGIKISLLPGPTRIVIPVRLQSKSAKGAVLLVRLGDQVLGTLFASKTSWDPSLFDMETQGGDYWLSAELLHDSSAGVELGDVLIRTGKYKELSTDGV